mmetsp:Transcript_12480/g.16999  ORF Transcript_12480/g.16999 Transcript_12480/m.16999 type:complete len:497 (+) Transcript_12480:163-1653(+)
MAFACTLAEQNTMTTLMSSGSMESSVAEELIGLLCGKFNSSSAILDAANVTMDSLLEADESLGSSIDGAFILANTYLVFFMQAGFAMLCAGSVRSKNCMNILLKNVLDACFGAPVFFLFGWGFAYGDGTPDNGFIGNNDFALVDLVAHGSGWHDFIFQWAFAAATATIVSGSVAERCTFQAYIGYSAFLTGFVYPVIVHWIWSGNGWLTAFAADEDLFLDSGMIDFAGSGVVHMTGGMAGLMGALVIGPRSGRFDVDGKPSANFQGHSVTLVVLGTFMLWFGWYGFNPGSMLAINGATNLEVVGRSAVTTTLSGASAGIGALFVAKFKNGHWDLSAVCNGVLAGLVGITAGCSVVEPAAAILCGFISSVIFDVACEVLLKLKIDDPLSASPMHGFCGMWGVLYVGLMAKEEYVKQAYGDTRGKYGAFYGGGGELLGCQIVGIICIATWTCCLIGPFFYALKMAGQLRVPKEEEMMGLDVSHHGGSAYNIEQPKHAV